MTDEHKPQGDNEELKIHYFIEWLACSILRLSLFTLMMTLVHKPLALLFIHNLAWVWDS